MIANEMAQSLVKSASIIDGTRKVNPWWTDDLESMHENISTCFSTYLEQVSSIAGKGTLVSPSVNFGRINFGWQLLLYLPLYEMRCHEYFASVLLNVRARLAIFEVQKCACHFWCMLGIAFFCSWVCLCVSWQVVQFVLKIFELLICCTGRLQLSCHWLVFFPCLL